MMDRTSRHAHGLWARLLLWPGRDLAPAGACRVQGDGGWRTTEAGCTRPAPACLPACMRYHGIASGLPSTAQSAERLDPREGKWQLVSAGGLWAGVGWAGQGSAALVCARLPPPKFVQPCFLVLLPPCRAAAPPPDLPLPAPCPSPSQPCASSPTCGKRVARTPAPRAPAICCMR